MERIRLKVIVRKEKELGSRASRRLRREGWIVGVVYGKDYGPLPVKMTKRDYEIYLKGRWKEGLVRLSIEDDGLSEEKICIVKEVQRDPLTDDVLNIDFMRVTAPEEGAVKGTKKGKDGS